MKPKLVTENGWTEALLDDDCEFNKFYTVADLLTDSFDVTFTTKVNDFDSIYWDFEFKGVELVLHYNVYLGISLFPKAMINADKTANDTVVFLFPILLQKLTNLHWSNFDQGKSIGTKGSEEGTIIEDIEHVNGARITLEKECGSIPFAITLGIYGLLVHTHYEGTIESATAYMHDSKYKINKLFDLYDVEENRRSDSWHEKHDQQINELAEITDVQTPETSRKEENKSSIVQPSWWHKIIKKIFPRKFI